jgi:GT2 family glycosyltransferase
MPTDLYPHQIEVGRATLPLDRECAPADLDVGVIYTGERHFLRPLLDSMSRATGDLTVRLVLVDNNSRDGVSETLDWPGPATVLHNRKRLGYAANLNRILRKSSARYVLLMNTDMEFDANEPCLSKMVRFMDRQPLCGVSICRLLHTHGGEAYAARRFPTLAMIAARRLGLAGVFPQSLDRYFYRDRGVFDSFECDWVSGCFLFIRREALRDIGELDERFVKYFEDVDFCARVARAGWQVMYHGGTWCYHHEQRASRRLFSRDALRHIASYLCWLTRSARNENNFRTW